MQQCEAWPIVRVCPGGGSNLSSRGTEDQVLGTRLPRARDARGQAVLSRSPDVASFLSAQPPAPSCLTNPKPSRHCARLGPSCSCSEDPGFSRGALDWKTALSQAREEGQAGQPRRGELFPRQLSLRV